MWVCVEHTANDKRTHAPVMVDAEACKSHLESCGMKRANICLPGLFGGKSQCFKAGTWSGRSANERGAKCKLGCSHKAPAGVSLKGFAAPGTWPANALDR